MVDSIVDNLSLRTQRRVELKLDLDLKTSATQLKTLMEGLSAILEVPVILQKTVLLTDISTDAYLVHCEYYTDTIAAEDFNSMKQEINLSVIALLEELGIEIAGAGKEKRLGNK